METPEKALTSYFSSHRIMIADSNFSSRTGLAKAIVDLGARTHQITLVDSYEWAVQIVEQFVPTMIVSDFRLGSVGALDLFQHPRFATTPMQDRLSVLVTSNTSQAAIAQAAEGEVDLFIAKPYSLDAFRSAMSSAAFGKIKPSEYLKTIDEGRHYLSMSKIDHATQVFEKAISLHPKPSLAYFYHGHSKALIQALEEAKSSFLKGLEHNRIHYKCLLGLYDALVAQRRPEDAYFVLREITRQFPLNTKRLNSALRLAITTRHYEDIEQYYRIFLEFETKDEECVRHICAALITAGKYFLKNGKMDEGFSMFQRAGVSCAGMTTFLSEIIMALVEAGRPDEADKYLLRFPKDSRGSIEFLSMDYLVMSKTKPVHVLLEQGRKLLREKKFHPLIDKIAARAMLQAGLRDNAENLLHDASRRWPEQAKDFLDLLK